MSSNSKISPTSNISEQQTTATPIPSDHDVSAELGMASGSFMVRRHISEVKSGEFTPGDGGGEGKQTGLVGFLKKARRAVTEGGTVFDGFLLAASQEVGQSILTLPYIFSLVGMPAGITLQFIFATMALYTNYLLVNLHTEFRARLAQDKNDPRSSDPNYIVSYHDIIGGLLGKTARNFTMCVVFFALLGLTTVQIIATSSNFYILSDELPKRTWSLIWGGLFSLVAFVPTFRHYRFLSVLGILTTTYTSWFMCVAAAIEGPDEDTVYDAPTDLESFFNGLVSILFIFGGHASNIEVADVMDDHSTYDQSYNWSFLYVFTLTLPNAISAYRTFGAEARLNANSFNLYPQSTARDIAIVMMSLHQLVAFGLFIGPMFHMWEKFLHVHDKPFYLRAVCRLPLCGAMLFLAVAFPFFGPVNAVLGAFTTTLATYIIPTVTFNLVFKTKEDAARMSKPVPKWMSLGMIRWMNWVLAVVVFAAGIGLGGWSAIKNFIRQIENFDYFAECYQC